MQVNMIEMQCQHVTLLPPRPKTTHTRQSLPQQSISSQLPGKY